MNKPFNRRFLFKYFCRSAEKSFAFAWAKKHNNGLNNAWMRRGMGGTMETRGSGLKKIDENSSAGTKDDAQIHYADLCKSFTFTYFSSFWVKHVRALFPPNNKFFAPLYRNSVATLSWHMWKTHCRYKYVCTKFIILQNVKNFTGVSVEGGGGMADCAYINAKIKHIYIKSCRRHHERAPKITTLTQF